MPEVYNWQLGRRMEFPYDEAHPQAQFVFVFNINRCIGCQTCTMACKSTWTFARGQEHMWWNNVETKPFGGYPRFWDARLLAWLDRLNPRGQRWSAPSFPSPAGGEAPYGRFEGLTVFEAARKVPGTGGTHRVLGYLPQPDEWDAPNIFEDHACAPGRATLHAELPEHRVWFFYLARLCNHCTYPACLAACPRQAIYKRPEDGVVLVDQSRCQGYQKCVEACPYKKVMYRSTTGVSEKCIACYPRLEGRDPAVSPHGEPAETRCMTSCPGKIRLQGLVRIGPDGAWVREPENPMYFLVRERHVALPLYPQFGTEPNGYYIPPRWVPRGYLEQMFGPGVAGALEQYCCPDRELLAVLQLFRTTPQVIARFAVEKGPKFAERPVTMPDGSTRTLALFNDTVIGYNTRGAEIVRVTIREPTFERSRAHANTI